MAKKGMPKSYSLNLKAKGLKSSSKGLKIKTGGQTFMNKKNVMDVSAGLRAAKKLGQKLQ